MIMDSMGRPANTASPLLQASAALTGRDLLLNAVDLLTAAGYTTAQIQEMLREILLGYMAAQKV